MENMKTKQQIIDRVKSIKEKAVNKLQYDIGSDLRDLERELSSLPDFNPNRIDEERMTNIYKKIIRAIMVKWFIYKMQSKNTTPPSHHL
jgi:DNA polymerase III delta subunit